MGKQYSLGPRDAQLLAAAAMFTFGYTGFGTDAAEFLNAQENEHPQLMPLTQGAVALLNADKIVGADEEFIGPKNPDAFDVNAKRLLKLGKELLNFTLEAEVFVDGPALPLPVAAPAPESPRGPKIIDVDPLGNPIFEPETQVSNGATYNLPLTHDEIHLVFWALRMAEGVFNKDVKESFEATSVYKRLRKEVVTESLMDAFITKFDNMHGEARRADGEEV